MVTPSNLVCRSSGDRRAITLGHRVKAKSTTLGATRSRLIQVLRHIGLYEEEIAARLDDEREMARVLEMERLEARRLAEGARAARREVDEQFARLAEGRRAACLLKEEMAFRSMSEEQKAARRLEDEIVTWLAIGEVDA